MKSILKILCFFFSAIFLGCVNSDESDFSGVYLLEHNDVIDSLIIYKNGTYYHAVYKNGKMQFSQRAKYIITKDLWTFEDYKNHAKDHGGWDTEFDNTLLDIRIPVDYEYDLYYFKQ